MNPSKNFTGTELFAENIGEMIEWSIQIQSNGVAISSHETLEVTLVVRF